MTDGAPITRQLVPDPPSRLRTDGPAAGLAFATTAGLGLGLWLAARGAGLGGERAAMLALLALTGWCALLAGPISAGARDRLGGLLRGASMTDGAATALIVLAVAEESLSALAAARVYLVWLAIALLAVSVVQLPRRPQRRLGIALLLSGLTALILLLPLLQPGPLLGSAGWAATAGAAWRLNPMAAVSAVAGPGAGFVWLEQPLLYRLTPLGQHIPAPPVDWWLPALLAAAGAAVAAIASVARTSHERFWHGT